MANYTFNLGDGNTTLSGLAAGDTVTFGPGIPFDSLSFLQDGDDLVIYTTAGIGLRLVDQLLSTPLVYDLLFDSGDTIPLNVSNPIFGTTHGATLSGTAADDIIYGGFGNNIINGNDGNDTVYAGQTNDVISGGNGDDILYGGDGNDAFISDAGNDILNGGEGHDYVDYSGSTNGVTVKLIDGTAVDGVYTDTLVGIEEIIGSGLDDTIIGSHNDDTISGEVGNDLLKGRKGNDWIDGGTGDDEIYGNRGSDTLFGGNGNDSLFGGIGNDTLNGQAGIDTLHGRTGADTFVFDSTAFLDVDTILDFTLSDNDAIDISSILNQYDPITDAITDFVQITDNGTDSFLAVDRDGSGSIYGFDQIANLSNVTGLTDEAALEAAGNLITS